jgi:hypothetical protein
MSRVIQGDDGIYTRKVRIACWKVAIRTVGGEEEGGSEMGEDLRRRPKPRNWGWAIDGSYPSLVRSEKA